MNKKFGFLQINIQTLNKLGPSNFCFKHFIGNFNVDLIENESYKSSLYQSKHSLNVLIHSLNQVEDEEEFSDIKYSMRVSQLFNQLIQMKLTKICLKRWK